MHDVGSMSRGQAEDDLLHDGERRLTGTGPSRLRRVASVSPSISSIVRKIVTSDR